MKVFNCLGEDAPSPPLLWAAAMEYCAEIRVENDCLRYSRKTIYGRNSAMRIWVRNLMLWQSILAENLLLLTERYWSSTFKKLFCRRLCLVLDLSELRNTGTPVTVKGILRQVRPVVRLPQ